MTKPAIDWREVRRYPVAFASLMDAVDQVVKAMDEIGLVYERKPMLVPLPVDFRVLQQMKNAAEVLRQDL